MFKSYSEKSKAVRALVQVHGISKETATAYLSQVDGKWGFDPDEVKAATSFTDERTVDAAALPTESDVQALAPQSDELAFDPVHGTGTPEQAAAEQHPEDDEHFPANAPSASAFGAFAMTQLTAPSNAAPVEPVRTATSQRVAGLKMDKNREARNGVKERSRGGLCRAVWDALNSMMTHDEKTGLANVPTVGDIKKLAEEKGWNVNNASIEYYQWRKFHGISGRGAKQI